jgi:glycosyltransferase involved in cell wall biosynthesis
MENPAPGPNPRVSIIIPAYNTASLIASCLDSVFSQTFRDFEAIVVNDGSPDTPELEQALQPYRDKIIYIVQPNRRAAGARNTAIGMARGELLAFLDSDDSWLPDHLASQVQLFDQDPAVDLTYADAFLISELPSQQRFMERCPSDGDATFEALVSEKCQIPISTVVARKSVIVKAGCFDESLLRCDDYDMWLRTAFVGRKIAYNRNPQARLYQGRPDSLGVSRAKMSEADLRILEKLAQTLPLTEAQRVLVQRCAAETKARYLLEEGKAQLQEGHLERARELFAEANVHLRKFKLGLVVRGLDFAPGLTNMMLGVWQKFRSA